MAKLTILVATMTALLLLVDASIYRTMVVIDEETNTDRMNQRCRDQFMQQEEMRECQEYIRQQTWSPRRWPGGEYPSEELSMCCQQLEDVDTQCRCNVLHMAVYQPREEMGMRLPQLRQALMAAQELPRMCRMQPGRCNFAIPWGLIS